MAADWFAHILPCLLSVLNHWYSGNDSSTLCSPDRKEAREDEGGCVCAAAAAAERGGAVKRGGLSYS